MTMPRHSVALLLPPLALLLGVPAEAFVGGIAVSLGRATGGQQAEISVPFSADAQMETEENTITSHVSYRPGMVRDDISMGDMQMTTIQRYDLKKVWSLMGGGMYMETDIGKSEQAPEYKLIERSVEGNEVVNGMQTTKYKTIYEGPDGRFGGFTWFTDDNIAVKGFIVSEEKGKKQRIKWTLSNVQREDQPASLFELPANARPMGMMNFGNMAGAAGGVMPGQTGGSIPGMPGQTGTSVPGVPAAEGDATPASDDPNIAEEMATDAAKTAEDTAKQETQNSIREGVSQGIRKLFGR